MDEQLVRELLIEDEVARVRLSGDLDYASSGAFLLLVEQLQGLGASHVEIDLSDPTAGASGFLLKDLDADELHAAVRTVAQPGRVCSTPPSPAG